MTDMTDRSHYPDSVVNRVAEVTIFFWIMKVIATTLGETAGDFVSMTLGLGYTTGLAITSGVLLLVLFAQVRAARFHPVLFWLAIIATTTAGTEVSDLMDRTLNLGYVGGSLILVAGLFATLGIWYYRDRDLSVEPIVRTDAELMFWIAVVFSNSLGTAFGDALVDVVGLTFIQGALVTGAVIAVVLLLHYATNVNRIALFWAAFIFTRPFGATFGDFLTKSVSKGGLHLGRFDASAVAVGLLMAVMLFAHRGRLVARAA